VKKNFDSFAFATANFIFTDDALQALQQLAAYHRRQFHYPVIGITGSNGKTIVKEWLHQLLSSSYNIVRSPRSYNSQVGVPLSLWLMKEEYSLGIFEAGISKPGEMQKLEKMIQPSIGIFTNIGEAHGENFLSQLEKAKEKCLLFQHAEWLVYPHDNPVIQKAVAATLPNIKTITWGRSEDATVQIIDIVKQEEQTLITILFNNSTHQLSIPFTDDASEQNALSCITTLLQLDIDAATIQQKLLQLQAVDMRLQLMEAINQCSVINDSYSFDITSFSAALDFLLQQHRYTNHTVIISDLPETTHINAYTQVAEMMRAKNIQRIITVGEQWLHYESLLKNHFSSVQQFISTEELLRQFSANHFRSEVILLKGARRFAFEKISDRLEKKVHQTVMEINLTALAHNLNQYMSTLRKDVKVMA
ncbi:MAG TPA: Mur ligase family protein, partial [Chitinophagaceae bacterium]|nr:Mur ligase family protein [Chitinophagaceae bacterium]